MAIRARITVLAFALSPLACSADDEPAKAAVPAWEQSGPHAIGHTVFSLEDAQRTRQLTVHLWYPAEAANTDTDAGVPITELLPEGKDRDTLAGLVAKAPVECTRRVTSSMSDADPWQTKAKFPLVVFSHCHGCTAFSSFSIAERLASHGFAVAAPDHAGDTLFDSLEGTSAPLDGEFLAVRAGDVRFVIDTLLDTESTAVPAPYRGRFDADQIGVFGHSYGAATTGLVLQEDPRVKAGFAIAAPMESPLLPGPEMKKISRPTAFLLAEEDNSITVIGNGFIRSNFEAAPGSSWLFEVKDAGHWSFSDICGLTSSLAAGCGQGYRQLGREEFTYLDNGSARDIGGAYVTAFMTSELLGNSEARDYLGGSRPEGLVTQAAH